MSVTKIEKLLSELHELLALDLKDRLVNGEEGKDGEVRKASPATLNVIRQFLRDNSIDGIPIEGSPLGDLIKSLPKDFGDEYIN